MEFTSNAKKANPKLAQINPSLRVKLIKVPKNDLDHHQSSHHFPNEETNTNNTMINQTTPYKHDDELEEGEIREVEVKLHVCPLCNKGFTSGKALGGHLSVHKRSSKVKKVPKMTHLPSAKRGVFRCRHCPKVFPSDKSLFGHMRLHWERDYRGMDPTKGKMCSFTSRDVAESSSATKGRMGMWRRKEKRSRKDSNVISSPVTYSEAWLDRDEDEAAMAVAANVLMLMANNGLGQSGKRLFESDDVEGYDVTRNKKGKGLMMTSSNHHGVVNESLFDDDEVYYLKNLGYLPNNCVKFDDDEVIKVNRPIKMLTPPRTITSKIKGIKQLGKTNHKIKSTNLESMEVDNQESHDNKWICNTCGKTFPTHQALGGHRSSHNKDKYNNQVVDEPGLMDNRDGGGHGEVVVNDASHDDEIGEHNKCKICDMIFGSGLALGGHKRCHCVTPSSDISSSPGQSSCQTGRVSNSMELIDLNLEPPMFDEDDGDVTADSSSNKHC